MSTIYIYRLIDPVTRETRYIGATANLFRRYGEHVNARHGYPVAKHQWICGLRQHRLKPFIHVLEVVESDGYNHLAIEDQWIEHFRASGAPLFNNGLRGSTRGKYSRFIGVSRAFKGWKASFSHNGRLVQVGYFPLEEDAARAYDAAAYELRGTSARLNFPADYQKQTA